MLYSKCPSVAVRNLEVSELGSGRPMYMFKMVSLGDATTGKTSCLIRYMEGTFAASYQATLGTNILLKNLEVETPRGKKVPVQLITWDLGGQPSFKELRLRYMAGASIAFIVYDVTSPASFMGVYEWYRNFISVNPNAVVAFVANKIDLIDRRVPPEAGEMLAKWLNVNYVETSAKTGENVEELFTELIEQGVKKHSTAQVE
ncbi:MAG: Rab family GTPase [Candidatus Thorarchaeota archaeon]